MLSAQRVPKEDLFGVIFVRRTGATIQEYYYDTIDTLRLLFADSKFREAVSGFYLNHIEYPEESGDFWVRISYFVNEANSKKAISVFRDFFKQNGLSEATEGFEAPRPKIVVGNYGPEQREEPFRYFLALETQIGLELMKADLAQARILFATYRLRTNAVPPRAREHFEPSFIKHSQTYASLSKEERERFLSDLENWGWAHMMMNFMLGIDFTRLVSISQMNRLLREHNMNLQVPLDWKREELY